MNLTPEQIQKIHEELIKAGMSADMNPFITQNPSDYASLIFSRISIQEIKEKISNFQKIDLKDITDNDLNIAIQDVMNIDVDGSKMHIFYPHTNILPANKRLYRVRMVNIENLNQFSTIGAYWNPPAEFISKPGRLNKAHESLLYTSLNPFTTFSELKISANQSFALIVYETLESIKANVIGLNYNIPELSEDDNQKYQLYNNFLQEEFTRKVEPGFEYLYRVSEYIAKFYFDLPPREFQDAWMYPSVASTGEYNICFRPEIAKEVLKIVGVIFGSFIILKDSPLFKCLFLAEIDSNNNVLYYENYEDNLDQMRNLFPEFISLNPNNIHI